MKVQIIGVQKGQSRNGRDFTNFFFQKPFTDYETSNGSCVGYKTDSEFTYINCDGIKPGDECELTYEPGYQDKATLTNIQIISAAKKG